MEKLPYLTNDLAGIGGKFKALPEDFYVEEIPSYQPCGEGQHIYLRFEKKGLTTLSAINRIAQSLEISPKAIGYAGLKDANAVTQQTVSINNVKPDMVEALNLSDIRVLDVARHRNKLKVGHLTGNKFRIRLRDVEQVAMPQVEKILQQLQAVGIPNYFGEQRFGLRDNSHLLGLTLMQGDHPHFLRELLGKP
ncbi:MAG: tRNA pseudouridine(13) synthase TruD, partial [Chloroflexota bacterium]